MAQTFNTSISFVQSTSRKDRRKGVGSLSVSAVAGGGVGSVADSATQAWVRNNFVDKTTEQEISALKIFSQGIKIGDIAFYKHPGGYAYLDETLVLKGGVVMYGNSSGVDVPSIFDSLPIDRKTIKRDGNGALYVDETALSISGGGGGGGVADSVYWNNVIGKPSWIGSTKPSYKYSEIEEKPDLSVYAKLSDIPSLSGYATQTWVEGKGYLLATTASSTYQPKITSSNKLAYSLISGTPDLSVYALKTAIPTELSQLTDDVVAGKYLPITGGTINGTSYNPLSIASNDNSLMQVLLYTKDTLRGRVQYNVNFGVGFHNVEIGGIYVKNDGTPIFVDSSNTSKTLLHAGNYSNLLAGGTINGSITAASFIGNLTGGLITLNNPTIGTTFEGAITLDAKSYGSASYSQIRWKNGSAVAARYGYINLKGSSNGHANGIDIGRINGEDNAVWASISASGVTSTSFIGNEATFSSKVVIGTIPVYESVDGTLYVDANVVFRGGVAMHGNTTTTINEE